MARSAVTVESGVSKSQAAYRWIKERIAKQDFTPGYRLVLASIATELDMSVVPVREAVRQLEAEGLVTFERNVGARVAMIDDTQYRFAMQAMTIFESAATALAARHLTADDLRRARAVNEVMTGSLDRFDPRGFSALNQEFHHILYSRCANPRLLEIVDAEWARIGHMRDSIFAFVPGRARESVHEHEDILTLIEHGAPLADIEQAVRRHRTGTLTAYLEHEHPDETLAPPDPLTGVDRHPYLPPAAHGRVSCATRRPRRASLDPDECRQPVTQRSVPMESPTGRRHAPRKWVWALALTALAVSGCGGGANDPVAAGPVPTSTTADAEAGASEVDQTLFLDPLDAYPVPIVTVANVGSLAGRTVFYIPIAQQSPQFQVTGAGLAEALAAAGINLQTCDGKGTPSVIDGCIAQAVDSGAMAIVADAVAYGLAASSYDAARAAGIPVVITNQVPDPAHPADATLAYIEGSGAQMQETLAAWAAGDSNGTAHVLINQTTEGDTPRAYVQAGLDEYARVCPACAVTINGVSSSEFQAVPGSTTAALQNDPSITYVESQFQQFLEPTQEGVEAAGRTETVKGMTGSAQLGALQALQSGTFLSVAVGQASAFAGWVYADAAIRLALHDELPEYSIPVRLFTTFNIVDVPVTPEAEASGEWYGPTDYRKSFLGLWGLS